MHVRASGSSAQHPRCSRPRHETHAKLTSDSTLRRSYLQQVRAWSCTSMARLRTVQAITTLVVVHHVLAHLGTKSRVWWREGNGNQVAGWLT